MLAARKFGKKLALPSTTQIKRQILLGWLEDQRGVEAGEMMQQKPASPAHQEIAHSEAHKAKAF